MCLKSERNTALQCGVCYKLKQLLKLHLKCRHAFPAVRLEITGKPIKRRRQTAKRVDKTVNSNAKALLSDCGVTTGLAYLQTVDSIASIQPINDVKIEVNIDSTLNSPTTHEIASDQTQISSFALELSTNKSKKNKTNTKQTRSAKRTVTDTKSNIQEIKVTKNTTCNTNSSTKEKTTKRALIHPLPSVPTENKTSIVSSLNANQEDGNKEISEEKATSKTTSGNREDLPNSIDDSVSSYQESSPDLHECMESNKSETNNSSTESEEIPHPYKINEHGFYNCRFCPSFFSSVVGVRVHECCHIRRGDIEALPKTNITKAKQKAKSSSYKKSLRDKGEKPFSCSICGARYAGKVKLERHEKRHKDEARKKGISLEKMKFEYMEKLENHRAKFPFECKKCGKGFRLKRNLIIHKKIHMQNVTCPVCKHVFQYKGMLKLHMRKHQTHKCSISGCEEIFSTERFLNIHISREHGDAKPMTCHCGEQVLGEWALRQHQQSTHGLVTYTCEECGESFKNNKVYNKHVGEHRAVRDAMGSLLHYACSGCNRTFKFAAMLAKHLKTHEARTRLFVCDVCEARFYTNAALQSHREIHGERTEICNVCGKGFAGKKNLRAHMYIHAAIKSLVCPKCPKTFSTSTMLRAHELTHVTPLPHVCHVCGKGYKWELSLQRHIQALHSGDEKPFACDLCDYRTKLKPNLVSHQAVHREPSHMCDFCGNKFKTKNTLRRHRRTHDPNAAKRWKCNLCDSAFYEEKYLTKHMLVHSDKKDVPCIYCDAMYKSRCSLPKHYRTQHPDRPYPIPPRKRYKILSKTSDEQPKNDEPTQATNITTGELDTPI